MRQSTRKAHHDMFDVKVYVYIWPLVDCRNTSAVSVDTEFNDILQLSDRWRQNQY